MEESNGNSIESTTEVNEKEEETETKKSGKEIPVKDYYIWNRPSKYSIRKWKKKKQRIDPSKSIDYSMFRRDKEFSDLYSKPVK